MARCSGPVLWPKAVDQTASARVALRRFLAREMKRASSSEG